MNFLLIFSVLLSLQFYSCLSLSVAGVCGDPGLPNRSKLTPNQIVYDEGQTVTYTCDDYISIKQNRKCVKGKWMGEPAVCGESFRDNDLIWAKIYSKPNGTLIKQYDTTVLLNFTKFGNSFIQERYEQPLRAYGSKSYRFELKVMHKDVIQLVRISFSLVNHLIDDRIRRSQFNITKVTVSPHRICRFYKQSTSPWFVNSTRFDFWFTCDSRGIAFFEKEITEKSDLVVIETESNNELDLDLATFILAKPYTADPRSLKEQICGTPERPTGLHWTVINHNSRYAFQCAEGFKAIEGTDLSSDFTKLECDTDMKWTGRLPVCLPEKTCKKFQLTEKHLIEVYSYEKVFFVNDTDWLAIEGTKAYFRCKKESQIFVGKEVRVCGKDGEWSDSLPNCLGTEKEAGFLTMTLVIVFVLFLIFSLVGVIVYCAMRINRKHKKSLKALEIRQSNIYDDYGYGYELDGYEGKRMEGTYETVYDERYADTIQAQRNPSTIYTPMTGTAYKYDYKDKNIYDDCEDDSKQYSTSNRVPKPTIVEPEGDASYVTMKQN